MPLIAAGIIGAAGIGGALINKSGSTNTTTQQSGPPAQVLQNYQNLVGQATGVSAGLSGLGGPPVADWNNELTSGIGNINQAGNAVNYFNSGLGALNTGMGTVSGALNYLPSEISGISAAQGMIPGAQGLVGAGASTMSGALPYYGAAGSTISSALPMYGAAGNTISSALPMYGAAANTEMSALPMYSQGASTLGGALSSYGAGLGTLSSATPYFGAGASLVGQSTANPFTSGAISQYMSPYINDVVNSTEQQFNNQNAIQANNLTSSAIMGGNAFGGDRAGVAQGVLAGQQQTAEAPVIAGLYNSGYQTAGQEATQEQGLMQSAGSLMGSLGSGLGNIGAEYGSLGAGMTSTGQAYGNLGSGIANVGAGIGNIASGEVGAGSALGNVGAGIAGAGSALGNVGAGIAGVGSGLGSLGSISGGLAGEAGSLAGMYGSAAGVQGGLGATQAGIGSQISALGPAYASTLEGLGGSQLTGGSDIQNWEQQNLSSGYQGLLNQLGVTGTQFLAPIVEGTGSLSGGTSTTTSPGPSMISQMAGLGVTGLALNQVTGGSLSSGFQNYLGSSPSYGGGNVLSGDAYGGNSSNPLPGLTSGDYGRYGGRIGYDDGGSVDDSSDNNDPSGLGGIVGYNALARELGTGAAANQMAAGLEEGVGFADGGSPNLPNATGQPLNMSALLQGSGAGIPGQYGMTFQRGPGPPGLHMGMGPPQPPRAAAPDNGLNNLLAQVQQVTRYMRPNQNQSRKGGRIAFGGAVNLPGHYDAGGSPDDSDASLPVNATLDDGTAPPGLAALQNATFGQESSYGANPSTSSAGAVGPMQVTPGTFSQYAQPGENIRNPKDNKAVGDRILANYYDKYNGDPARAAVAYYSGPGNVAPPDSPTPWVHDISRDHNGNPIKPVSSYVSDVIGRMGGDTQPGLAALPAASTPTQGTLPSAPTPSSAIGKPDPWQAVLAAGLGMMAGQSPHALSNIGQGGLMGLQNYQQQKVELREEASQQLAAQRLAQEAAYQQGQLKNETDRTSILQQSAQQESAVRARTSMTPVVIGHDAFMNPIYGIPTANGFINPQTMKPMATPGTPAAPGTAPGAAIDPSVHGDDYLKSLPPDKAAIVKQVAEGRSPFPSGFVMKTPYGQWLSTAVSQYDPGFSAATWNMRNATLKEWNAGGPNAPASLLTAGNTAIQHLGKLSDAAEQLQNWSGWSILNKPLNMMTSAERSMAQDPRVSNFDTIRNKYIEEATKFYRGTGGNEADLQRDIASLNSAQTPEQLRQAIANQAGLMQGKINALQDRWTHAMTLSNGKTIAPPFPIVQDISQKALDKIQSRENATGSAPAGEQSKSPQPSPQTPPVAGAKLYQGKWYTRGPNGEAVPVQ